MSCLFKAIFRFLPFRLLSPSSTVRKGESINILIVGSLGVGKSSLLNMIIGRSVAPASNDIGVVHAAVVEYTISLREMSKDTSSPLSPFSPDTVLRFYDTVGMEHRPSPLGVIKARLGRNGGADIVIYCMRRGRLSSEQVTHLRTIRKSFCRGGVPLLLVVSGIEYRRGSIGKWWEENSENLKNAADVEFADHICLNTWDPSHASWKHQGTNYEETQRHIRELLISQCTSLPSVL